MTQLQKARLEIARNKRDYLHNKQREVQRIIDQSSATTKALRGACGLPPEGEVTNKVTVGYALPPIELDPMTVRYNHNSKQ